ncbi:hypothetical protein [Corynebacterium sp. SA-MJD20WY100]
MTQIITPTFWMNRTADEAAAARDQHGWMVDPFGVTRQIGIAGKEA